MTTGTMVASHPSPPFACSIDVLFRFPFIRACAGGSITTVQNRANGVWHEQAAGSKRLRLANGVVRGDFRIAFPALAGVTHATPAAAVLPVDSSTPVDAIHRYLHDVRREVQRA